MSLCLKTVKNHIQMKNFCKINFWRTKNLWRRLCWNPNHCQNGGEYRTTIIWLQRHPFSFLLKERKRESNFPIFRNERTKMGKLDSSFGLLLTNEKKTGGVERRGILNHPASGWGSSPVAVTIYLSSKKIFVKIFHFLDKIYDI